MSQKELSRSILEKITINHKTIYLWFDNIEQALIARFERQGFLMPYYTAIMSTENIKIYKSITIKDLPPDPSVCYHLLHTQNFEHGYPLTACSFCSMMETHNEAGVLQMGVLITFETPLFKRRKIYLVHEVEGKKKLIMDGFLSRFGQLDHVINRFQFLIASEQNTTQ